MWGASSGEGFGLSQGVGRRSLRSASLLEPGVRLVESSRSVYTNRPHSGGGGAALLREGGAISYEARPS